MTELKPLLEISAELKAVTEKEREHLVACYAAAEVALSAHTRTAELHGAIRHGIAAIVQRSEAEAALKQLQPSWSVDNPGPVRLLAVLVVVLASLCVSASPRTHSEVRPVTATDTRTASASILAGKAAMLKGDYRVAIDHFQDAGTHGAAAEAWLPGMIECYLEIQQYGLALGLVVDLAAASPRNQSLVPFFRGQAYAGLCRYREAVPEFAEAKGLGHPLAEKALSKLGGK